MKVNNINGTSGSKCSCGSWIAHWKKYSTVSLSSYCYEAKCTEKPEHGAHVQRDGSTDRSWYIIPLCVAHNRQTGSSLFLVSSAILVPANVAATCGS